MQTSAAAPFDESMTIIGQNCQPRILRHAAAPVSCLSFFLPSLCEAPVARLKGSQYRPETQTENVNKARPPVIDRSGRLGASTAQSRQVAFALCDLYYAAWIWSIQRWGLSMRHACQTGGGGDKHPDAKHVKRARVTDRKTGVGSQHVLHGNIAIVTE
jgi:hypothetical protein